MWKGAVPQKLVDLLASLGMRKREINTTAREITNLLENTAMDLWTLTNAIRERAPQITEPAITLQQKAERLEKAGMLGYSMQQFKNKHIEHRRNVVAKRHRDFHGCEDLAVIAPGQSLREYAEMHGSMKQIVKKVEKVCEHDYQLTGSSACTSALGGIRKISPTDALQREIGTDGLTRQERGMIDRELLPERRHAGARKKYVRAVRQRSAAASCCPAPPFCMLRDNRGKTHAADQIPSR